MENENNYVIKTGSRKVNRIEELEGLYYPISEYIYYRVPVEYKVGKKFTAKKLPAACISFFVFVYIIKYLSEVDFEITQCCAMFPLFLILLAVFLNAVLPRDPFVTKDSQIVEAQVTDVKSYRTRFGLCHIATLYVPVLNKKVEVGLNAAAGSHVIIVRQNNTLTFVKMHGNYVPE